MILSFRIWDIKNKKYVDNCAVAISNRKTLLIGDGYLFNSLKEINPENYCIEYSTGYKDINGKDLYVNDYVEYQLGLKRIRCRIIYDNFAFRLAEIRGGYMDFTQQEYTLIGNQNTAPVN